MNRFHAARSLPNPRDPRMVTGQSPHLQGDPAQGEVTQLGVHDALLRLAELAPEGPLPDALERLEQRPALRQPQLEFDLLRLHLRIIGGGFGL